MWKFLANLLQEMVKANLIQHKILNTSYYIDFFAVNMKVIIMSKQQACFDDPLQYTAA